jgi:hypothetical protein
MDLGVFRRSKAVFSLWLLLPLFTVIAIDLGSAGFCFWAKRSLLQNRDMMQTIGELTESRQRAEDALAALVQKDGALPATSQEISSWLDEVAPRSEFTLETLSVIKSDGSAQKSKSRKSRRKRKQQDVSKPKKLVPYIGVTLKGRGSYLSLVRFIRDLESQYLLVHVTGIGIRAQGDDKSGTYLCDLTFNVYLVES